MIKEIKEKNFIIEGTDASGKEQLGKILEIILLKNRIHLNKILEELNININNVNTENLENFFNYYKKNNIISDRSFLSLLNYFLITNKDILKNKFIIRNLLTQYLESINGGIIIFITTDYKKAKERLLFREKEFNEKLSQNDKKIIENENYFNEYKNNLLHLISISEKIINNKNLNIKIIKLDSSFVNILTFIFYKKIIKFLKKF